MALTLIKCHPFNARNLLLADVRPIIPNTKIVKKKKRFCSLKVIQKSAFKKYRLKSKYVQII
jgi:hypothetical protein